MIDIAMIVITIIDIAQSPYVIKFISKKNETMLTRWSKRSVSVYTILLNFIQIDFYQFW
jgi:hypothetical protein